MNTGAPVVIINSPYYAIQDGTKTYIEEIKRDHFGPGTHLYIIANLPYKAFLDFEIEEEIIHGIQKEA